MATQPTTQHEDAVLPAVSPKQRAQAVFLALLLCLQSRTLHIHARVEAVTAAVCSAFSQQFTEVRSICSGSVLHHWAAVRLHTASTALAFRAWWSATAHTLVSTITRSLRVVLAAADFLTRTCKTVMRACSSFRAATISAFSILCSACIACMASLFLGGSVALHISFGILADWRLMLCLTSSVVLMTFGWFLLEWLWELNCRLLHATACVLLCYYLVGTAH